MPDVRKVRRIQFQIIKRELSSNAATLSTTSCDAPLPMKSVPQD